MMAFDSHRRSLKRDRLDHIGIERPLSQELNVRQRLRGGVEHFDKRMADNPAFLLGVLDFSQILEKLGRRLHTAKIESQARENPCDLLGFVLAQESVVNEDTGETLTDSAVDEQGHHRGINPTAEPADNPAVCHPFANLADFALNEPCHCPRRLAVADAKEKVMQ